MTRRELIEQIERKRSVLCVGLDTDLDKIPPHLLEEEDPLFAFNKAIIDATAPYAVAFKPNVAFYEPYGTKGWQALERTIAYLNSNYPEVFTIADAKRGDIGNTSQRYAEAFLKNMDFDSITVAPYMGSDSVEPFLTYENKWVVLLALTSNGGALDFQLTKDLAGVPLYQKVVKHAMRWGTPDQLMFVLGATRTEYLEEVRKVAPEHFFLVPGVGAQGGSLEEVLTKASNNDYGILVNSTRGIIYNGSGHDFAEAAAQAAADLQKEMSSILFK